MVGSSKILTVSYGTFSCTLEGFDDSFGTMKAIAEYFRDLAADDRYFGAEPPVPDAEMLARIAEREIARRVEARMDASGIVLRVGSAIGNGDADAPVAKADEQAADTPAATDVPADTTAGGPADMAPAEAIAADAPQEITPAPTAVAAPTAEEAHSGDVTGPDAEEDLPVPSPLLAASGPVTDDSAGTDDYFEDLIDEGAGVPAAEAAQVTAADAAVRGPVMPPVLDVPAHPDADSVAAKLQRIRAVVGRGNAQMAPDAEEDLAPAAMPMTGAADAGQPAEAEGGAAHIQDATTPDASTDQLEATDSDHGPDRARVRARVIRMRRADFDKAAGSVAAVAAGSVNADAMDRDDNTGEDGVAAITDADADLADLARLDGMDTPDAAIDATIDPILDLGEGTLSPEDEAALLAELEDVTRETADLSDDGKDAGDAAFDENHLATLMVGLAQSAPEASGSDRVDEDDDDDAEITDLLGEDVDWSDAGWDDDAAADDDADVLEAIGVSAARPDAAEGDETLGAQTASAGDMQADDDSAGPDTGPDTGLDTGLDTGPDTGPDTGIEGFEEDDLSLFDADEVEADDVADSTDNHAAWDRDAADAHADTPVDAPVEDPATIPVADLRTGPAELGRAELGRAVLSSEPDADEAAMSRILTQTNAELAEPQSSRRRDAIAQLKAAVAATEAARRLGDVTADDSDEEVENAFRDDLRQVVRPRRAPRIEELRSERPRPAPLKLVAAQRVDLPAQALGAAGPVRPRRVSLPVEPAVPAPAASQGAGSFAEFAEEMGASALPDLLEAAAAYTAFVEGVEDFSRPQLMKKVIQVAPDGVSREDGLRSFGTLLRQGRIMKVRNGRFQVSGESRFNPERRAG